MKIALISFEYPPDTAEGGIATYVQQAAKMLQSRGNQVEVFAGSRERSGTETEDNGIRVHRVQMETWADFPMRIAPVFADRHAALGFDVLEGPDYRAEAAEAVRLVPDIPLVLKLHTPRALLGTIGVAPLTRLRVKLGSLRRGINPFQDLERDHALEADEIAAPSWAIGEKLIQSWKLERRKVHLVPLPYTPSAELLNIPIESNLNTVTFLGRLEVRKGVLDFAKAIPLILNQYPSARFCLVGRPGPSPDPARDMAQYLKDLLQPYQQSVEFKGPVALDQVPQVFAASSICVFPSLWDSFGLVCLEAMAAGRSVVGSNAGGMAEIINAPDVGRLVPPSSPKAIAEAVVELLQDPDLQRRLGTAARERVLNEYNVERVGNLQEASYRRAIELRRALGARSLKSLAKV